MRLRLTLLFVLLSFAPLRSAWAQQALVAPRSLVREPARAAVIVAPRSPIRIAPPSTATALLPVRRRTVGGALRYPLGTRLGSLIGGQATPAGPLWTVALVLRF